MTVLKCAHGEVDLTTEVDTNMFVDTEAKIILDQLIWMVHLAGLSS